MMKLPVFLTLLAATVGTAGAAATSVCALTLSPQMGAPMVFAPESPTSEPGLLLVDSDEDDDDDKGGWSLFGDDDDEDDDDEDEDCDDDEDGTAGCETKGNAAPAGTVEPPKNGLFGDGKAPSVKTN